MKVTKGTPFRIAARRRLKVTKGRIPFRIATCTIDKKSELGWKEIVWLMNAMVSEIEEEVVMKPLNQLLIISKS